MEENSVLKDNKTIVTTSKRKGRGKHIGRKTNGITMHL